MGVPPPAACLPPRPSRSVAGSPRCSAPAGSRRRAAPGRRGPGRSTRGSRWGPRRSGPSRWSPWRGCTVATLERVSSGPVRREGTGVDRVAWRSSGGAAYIRSARYPLTQRSRSGCRRATRRGARSGIGLSRSVFRKLRWAPGDTIRQAKARQAQPRRRGPARSKGREGKEGEGREAETYRRTCSCRTGRTGTPAAWLRRPFLGTVSLKGSCASLSRSLSVTRLRVCETR